MARWISGALSRRERSACWRVVPTGRANSFLLGTKSVLSLGRCPSSTAKSYISSTVTPSRQGKNVPLRRKNLSVAKSDRIAESVRQHAISLLMKKYSKWFFKVSFHKCFWEEV